MTGALRDSLFFLMGKKFISDEEGQWPGGVVDCGRRIGDVPSRKDGFEVRRLVDFTCLAEEVGGHAIMRVHLGSSE